MVGASFEDEIRADIRSMKMELRAIKELQNQILKRLPIPPTEDKDADLPADLEVAVESRVNTDRIEFIKQIEQQQGSIPQVMYEAPGNHSLYENNGQVPNHAAVPHPSYFYVAANPSQDQNAEELERAPPGEAIAGPSQEIVSRPSTLPTQAPGTSYYAAPRGDRGDRPQFRADRQVNEYGKHPVLVYDIPDSLRSYVFSYWRKTAKSDHYMYRCQLCRKVDKHTGILVHGEDFLDDHTAAGHACTPIERTKDKAERMSYKERRSDPNNSVLATMSYWNNVVATIERMS
ncbi:hypothetical protein Aduo_018897 [Ancylostoma duodenale]